MEHKGSRAPWALLGILCLSFFMIVLDTTIVNVAIPAMMEHLAADLDAALWVVNAYVITYAVFMIPAGRLGARYGPKPVYAAGLVLFTVSSALCGLADGIGQLLLWRAVQGVGAALVTPQVGAFIAVLFPAHRRGAAFGMLTSVLGLSIVAGPLLGGLLVTTAGWQWIFMVNVPAGTVALVLALLFLPSPRPGGERGVDLAGLALLTTGLTAVTFALLGGGHRPPFDHAFLTRHQMLCAGLVCLVLFGVQQRSRTRAPLVPRALFAHRDFALANGIGAGVQFAVIGTAAPFALFLQQGLDRSALQSGLLTAPTPLAAAAAAHVSGRLSDRFGGKPLVLAGLVTYAYGLVLMGAQARPGLDPWSLLPAMLTADVGIGCALAPLAKIATDAVEPRHAGAASGVLNTTRQIGGVLGSAAVGALISHRTRGPAADASALADALQATTLLTTGVLATAVVLAMALRPGDSPAFGARSRRTVVLRLDALSVVVRDGPHYRSAQILTAIRVGRRGRREVIGFEVAGIDATATWSSFLQGLRARGLASVDHAVCGDTPGLAAAVSAVLDVPVRAPRSSRDPAGLLRKAIHGRVETLAPDVTPALLAAAVQQAVGEQNTRWAQLPGTPRRSRRRTGSMSPDADGLGTHAERRNQR
ncbi:DHA2 family efflux MFS transporter permease subunit [Streptomyces sp. NPDC020719]|uniref:DHA2 family efflux MFS transporter permease subunit n=1 Tax=Streptomyces sp. NPDC020719 TaxID=3154896 RepID=UPI0033FAEB47